MSAWIEESYKEGLALRLGLKKCLFSGTSPFQKIEVYESSHHGRVLLNDGCFMISERDERIYHEMMAHVPLNTHPDAKRVLIIGGGDGGTAREVLRHRAVEACTLVEIDVVVVEACRKFIPQTASVFDDPRLNLHIGDGVAYLRECTETFDVILIDSTDPAGAAEPLFGAAFYQSVAARLAANGIVIAQAGSAFYELETQARLMNLMAPFSAYLSAYNFTNMTYPGGLWSFIWASRKVHPLRDLGHDEAALGCNYYNRGIHKAAFALPEYQKAYLGEWTKI